MKIDPSILNFLDDEFNLDSYEIWIYTPRVSRFNLIYSKGQMEKANYKLLERGKQQDSNYFIFNNFEDTYLSFSFQNGYHVVIRIAKNSCNFDTRKIENLYVLFELWYTKELLKTRDIELEILIESIKSVSSTLVLDEILKKIVKDALSVIPVANAGTLVLYDSITEHLIMKAAVGFSPTINLFKTKVGEGITGKVFQDGQPRIFNSTIEIYKKMNENSISKENLNFLILSVKDGYVKAMISVPVSIGDKRIGVMTVHQMDSEGKFTKRDLDLLQGFGSQAAIAIQNAKLYSQLNEKLKELSKRNEVHETLIHLSLQNKGIKKIIDKIGKMINRNVVFFDYLENEWYYSRKNQKSNFSIDEISVIFSNRTSGVIVDVLKPNEETYYLYPIINGSVFLGCFIIELSNPLAVLERIIIQQGGSILALELVKKHTLEEIYYKKTHEFFTEILQKKDSDELVSNEKEFHLNPASFFFVGVIEIIDYKDLQKLEADIYSLVSLIKRENSKVNLIYGFHNKIIFLVSALNSSFLNNSIYDLKTIINTWAINRNNSIYVGIGSTYKGIHHVAKSYDEAKKAISYLLNFKGTGIITYEEIGVNRLFINQDPNEIERFLNDFFIPLKTNRSKKNDLEKTLLTYIAHNKSINDTSKALHIHVNTLYQRLKKIEEVLEVNFNDPKDFLKIQLACYLKETFTVS